VFELKKAAAEMSAQTTNHRVPQVTRGRLFQIIDHRYQ
jgi:hypothetical protein